MALGNAWLALSCLLACVVALWSTRTYVLLYELCCSVQGRLNAIILCLRYVRHLWLWELGLCLRGVGRREEG